MYKIITANDLAEHNKPEALHPDAARKVLESGSNRSTIRVPSALQSRYSLSNPRRLIEDLEKRELILLQTNGIVYDPLFADEADDDAGGSAEPIVEPDESPAFVPKVMHLRPWQNYVAKNPDALKKPTIEERIAAKRFEPKSIQDVKDRLAAQRRVIKRDKEYCGPKYTEEELDYLVKEQKPERFLARVVFYDKETAPGQTLGWTRDSKRAPYWTTTVDAIEDADSDPILLGEILGIDGDLENGTLGLLIIDTEALPENTTRETFIPTRENFTQFCVRELASGEISEADLRHALTEEYGEEYAGHAAAILEENPDNDYAVTDPRSRDSYIDEQHMDESEESLFTARNTIDLELGANRHYSGIGKTKIYRNAPKKRRYRSQISGSTEFFTFERDPLTIEQLGPEAVSYQPLTPIKELHG